MCLVQGPLNCRRAHISEILFFDIFGFTSSSLVFPMVLLNFYKFNIFLFLLIWELYFHTCMLNWAKCTGHFPYRGNGAAFSPRRNSTPHHCCWVACHRRLMWISMATQVNPMPGRADRVERVLPPGWGKAIAFTQPADKVSVLFNSQGCHV